MGKIVSITSFERFRTEFNFDFVYIYDGTGQSKTKLASFSGLLSSITRISSTGRVLQIIFTRFFINLLIIVKIYNDFEKILILNSDNSLNYEGFKFFYEIRDPNAINNSTSSSIRPESNNGNTFSQSCSLSTNIATPVSGTFQSINILYFWQIKEK